MMAMVRGLERLFATSASSPLSHIDKQESSPPALKCPMKSPLRNVQDLLLRALELEGGKMPKMENVYRGRQDTLFVQESNFESLLDSGLSDFFSKCLAPSYHTFSEDVKLKNDFGRKNHTLDALLRFLNNVLKSAKEGNFNLEAIKTILKSLREALNSRDNPHDVKVQASFLNKLFKDVASKLSPALPFSRNLLTLFTRLYTDELGKLDEEAIKGAANFFLEYFIQFINGQKMDKRYKEVIEYGLRNLIPLAVKRVLSNGGELSTEDKMLALQTILKVFVGGFDIDVDDSSLEQLAEKIFSADRTEQESVSDLQDVFNTIFTVSFKCFPDKEVLNVLRSAAGISIPCDDAIRELIRVLPEHLTELLGGNGST